MAKTSKGRRGEDLKRATQAPLHHARTNSVQGTGKASSRGVIHHARTEQVTRQTASLQPQLPPAASPFLSPAVRGPESLIFPAMVALGCWGIVIYFLFLTSEANHILFGGMAVLMALLWTFSFGTRVRKLLQQRSRM